MSDDDRKERERDFSRRALLRAGAVLPVGLAFGSLAAACSGGAHADASHADHTDGGSTTTSTTATNAPSHSDHSDSHHTDTGHADTHSTTTRSATNHADTPHSDTAHVDMAATTRTIHDDSGSHSDHIFSHGDFADSSAPPGGINHDDAPFSHQDSGPHADSTVKVPTDHEDTPHGDTPHADHS